MELPEELYWKTLAALHLKAGQKFAFVVHLTTKDAIYPIAVEYAKDKDQLKAVTIEDGEIYISSMCTIWSNKETECDSNICLKAYVNHK